MPSPASIIPVVPVRTQFFQAHIFDHINETWVQFFEALAKRPTHNPIVGFVINNGAAGANVGPMLPAPSTGIVEVCAIVVKAADPALALTFDIKQNGVSIFTRPIVIQPATAGGTLLKADNFVSSPMGVTEYDIFSIDILTGSAAWQFATALQTKPAKP